MLIRKLSGTAPQPAFPRGTVDTQMHLYLPDFPAVTGGPGLPAGDLPDPEAYRQVMGWLGIDRAIITQGNAHQSDNRNLLACLEAMAGRAWGVAVITPQTGDAEIEALSAHGVLGARIMDLPGGAVGFADLEAIDAKAYAAGWMLAVQFDGSRLLEHMPRLQRLKSRWVIDHHAKIFAGAAADSPVVDAILSLLDQGNVWFKCAASYESSREVWPYEDIAARARRITSHAPERIVWGTNWPHNGIKETKDYPDDAALAMLELSWLPQGWRDRILVENPEMLYGLPPFVPEAIAGRD